MSKNIYIKKYWDEEDTTFYIHFNGDYAVRQINITPLGVILSADEKPVCDNTFLYDQKFSDIDWEPSDFITEEEFNNKWNSIIKSND